MGTYTDRAALYISGGMENGCERVGSPDGGGTVEGRAAGGNRRRDSGMGVKCTEGAVNIFETAIKTMLHSRSWRYRIGETDAFSTRDSVPNSLKMQMQGDFVIVLTADRY